MTYPIDEFIQKRISEFDQISAERKELLEKIATYINTKRLQNKTANLVYICIHNSRRSHFGQVAGSLAANYYGTKVNTFSGGTEVTAFNPNAIAALRNCGLIVQAQDESNNPHQHVYYKNILIADCFSKIYDHPTNPTENFAAIMTCGEAEQNCPFIPTAEMKISTTYDDPKSSDGTGQEETVYGARFAQILRESLYVFSLVKS